MRGPPPRHPDDQRDQIPPAEGVILDAGELKPGDRVVYPNQGVCAIDGMEEKDISGQKLLFVKMRREEDGATVMVPRNKVPSIGLRRVASNDQIEGVFHYLAAIFDDPELDWKIRHRDNADRLIAGGVLGVAEVVKGLHSLSRIRPLPTKEREQYDNARHLLVNEIAVSLNVPGGLAEDYIDYALMPPAGTKFDLKPPPTPVALPPRQRRRPTAAPAAEAEGEGLDDLGLGDLGIDLGATDLDAALGAVGEGAAVEGEGVAEGEGAGEAEGGGEGGGEGEAADGAEAGAAAPDDEVPVPRKSAKAPAPKVAEKKPAPKPKAEKKPAPAKKAAAPKKAEKKPAPKAKAEKKPAKPAKKGKK